jgi:soluble lytic murein transglycosylase-like protein
MFLFTTPPARDPAPANPVVDAIRQGAERTGVGFDYLLATAQKESALDPKARGARRQPGSSSSSSRPGSAS